jgi:hypothetical protein
MSRPHSHCLLLVLGLVGLMAWPASARAEQPPRERPLHVYFTTGATVYLSDARTMGGVGGGFGVRGTLDERFLLQAELSSLLIAGTVTSLRVGAGLQRPGLYTPAVLLTLGALFGDRMAFLTPSHPTPVQGPAVTLGVTVAPLRFTHGWAQVSVLQLGVGVGSDFPGLGLSYHLGLAEVGLSF